MKCMCYIYRSKVGTFTIEFDVSEEDMYSLCIGGMWLGNYKTAEHAADDVYTRGTGWMEWDRCEDADGPRDLSEWETAQEMDFRRR